MASQLLRKTLSHYNQSRRIHRSTVAFRVPVTFKMSHNKQKFDQVLPEVMDTLMSSPKLENQLPEVRNWIKKTDTERPLLGHYELTDYELLASCNGILERIYKIELLNYTMDGGKQGRGLAVPFAYQKMEDAEYFTEEKMHTARFLGWCIETLQASLLAIDDIVDVSTTRRGKPCWYLQPDVGTSAINDCFLIYHCFMELIELKFGKEPYFADLVKLINETVLYTTIGEYLDYSSGYTKGKNNLDTFTMERFNNIAVQKTGYYSFRLPLLGALFLVKNGKERDTKELCSISLEFGKILQFQNDYKDIYWDEASSGKAGTDIQEGKLSWFAVAALERCTKAQRAIFKEYYGSKDPEHVKRIKQLYDELQIGDFYKKFENSVYESLERRIYALPRKGETEFFLEVMETCRNQDY